MHNGETINACSGELILFYLALKVRARFRAAVSVSHIGKEILVFDKGFVRSAWRWCGVVCDLCLAGLCVALAGAAGTDLVFGKVRNGWILFWMAVGVWFRGGSFVRDAGIVLIPAFFLFRMRMMGAGDGKLMAVIAGYLGIFDGILAIWTGLCLGAFWSLCRIRQREGLRARLRILAAYVMRTIRSGTVGAYEDLSGGSGTHRIPLAVCLAAGVYLFLVFSRMTGRSMG